MTVSVALCTFDGAAYVDEQVRSIAAQTQRPDEIVICDDASSDGTWEKLQQLAQQFPGLLRLHRNPQRLGTTKNFEQAVALCTAEAIFLSDQDDVWLPHKVQRLTQELAQGADLAFSNADVVDAARRPLGYRLWDSLWFSDCEQAKVRSGKALEVFLRHVVAAGGTLCFRASLRSLALPIPDLRVAHDAWIALMAAATGKVCIVPESLIQYRLHDCNQVGLRKLSLRQQVEQARRQLSTQAFAYAAELHEQALLRLTQSAEGTASTHTLQLLQEKIRHSRCRHEMNGSWLGRLPAIARETAALRYFRYSYGIKSIAQDLFLR